MHCDKVGCEILTFKEMCCAAHYSPGVARGGRFTPFKCPRCGYSPREEQWRKDVADNSAMDETAQKAANDVHLEVGVSEEECKWDRHWYQFKFKPPGVLNGMESAGVDNFHLIELNIFKMLFNYTIHQSLPGALCPLTLLASEPCSDCILIISCSLQTPRRSYGACLS